MSKFKTKMHYVVTVNIFDTAIHSAHSRSVFLSGMLKYYIEQRSHLEQHKAEGL